MFYVVRVHLECLLLGVHAAHGEDLDQGHGGTRHDKLRSHEEQQPVSTAGWFSHTKTESLSLLRDPPQDLDN